MTENTELTDSLTVPVKLILIIMKGYSNNEVKGYELTPLYRLLNRVITNSLVSRDQGSKVTPYSA